VKGRYAVERNADEARTNWSSWHLHLGSRAASLHDRVLTDVAAPAVESVGDRPWFFIRYWQGGPHLRLRIGDLDARSFERVEWVLRERLSVVGRLAPGEEPVAGADYRREAARHATVEAGRDRTVEELRAPGVYRSTYEPEFDRYGGADLMPRTERLFRLSSELVLALIPHVRDVRQRWLLALRATVSAAAALGDEGEQAYFYEQGLRGWCAWAREFGYPAEQIDRLCAAAGAGGVDPAEHGPFGQWHAAIGSLAQVVRHTTPVHPGRIVSSHVHMLHNRLGVGPLDELRTYAWLTNTFPVTERVPAAG
jgi:thiopeptide-type bacteriocin biosynthesis protein